MKIGGTRKTLLAYAIGAYLGSGTMSMLYAAELAPNQKAKQKEQQEEVETIEVEGIRSSLTSELTAKRLADTISDSIIAEDIGKSSDENIGEAISRIAGVSLDSEGGTVTVRGIEASLNDIKLNGVSMTSSSDDQAVDLSLFSADMLSRIDVVKSPSANQEEGSLGASINLRTRGPLSSKRSKHAISLQTRYSELAEKVSPRLSYSFVENFSETIGFGGSFFYDEKHVRNDGLSVSNHRMVQFYDADDPNRDFKNKGKTAAKIFDYDTGEPIEATYDNPIFALSSNGVNNRVQLQEKIKKGGTVTFQYRPTDETDIRLDATFSRQDVQKRKSQIKMDGGDRDTKVNKNVYIRRGESTNTVYKVQADLMRGIVQTEELNSEIDNAILGLNVKQLVGDYWTLYAKLGYSKTNQELVDGIKANWEHGARPFDETEGPDDWCSYGYKYGSGGDFLPEMTMCNRFDSSDPESIRLTKLHALIRGVDDNKTSIYLDAERIFYDSFFTSIEMGVKYTDREKFVDTDGGKLGDEHFETIDFNAEGISNHNLTDGRYLNGLAPEGAPQNWLAPDMRETLSIVAPDGLKPDYFSSDPTKRSTVFESTYGAYAQFNFQLFDDRITGNFGTRYAKTELGGQSVSTIRFMNGLDYVESFMALPENGGDPSQSNYRFLVYQESDYDNWLPSATVNFVITEDLLLRTAAARVMARPRIKDTRPNYNIKADNGSFTPSGKGGNNRLQPFLADQYDMSLEWYFSEGSLLSANAFYKNFVSYNYTTKEIRTYEGKDYPLFGHPGAPDCLVDQSAVNENNPTPCAEVPYTTRLNGGKADIKGIEFSYQQHYDFLPGILQHIGTSINYTYADSNQAAQPDEASPFNNMPFNKTSKHSANVRAYWQNKGVSYRLAYSYRSRAIGSIVSSRSTIIREAKDSLDFSANWKLTKNLKLSFSAKNLLDYYDTQFNVLNDTRGLEGVEGVVKEMDLDLSKVPKTRLKSLSYKGRQYRVSLQYKF